MRGKGLKIDRSWRDIKGMDKGGKRRGRVLGKRGAKDRAGPGDLGGQRPSK